MLAEKDLHKEEIYKTLGAYTKLLNRQRNYRHKKNPTTTKENDHGEGIKIVPKDQLINHSTQRSTERKQENNNNTYTSQWQSSGAMF